VPAAAHQIRPPHTGSDLSPLAEADAARRGRPLHRGQSLRRSPTPLAEAGRSTEGVEGRRDEGGEKGRRRPEGCAGVGRDEGGSGGGGGVREGVEGAAAP
jgi:hypothetical protein